MTTTNGHGETRPVDEVRERIIRLARIWDEESVEPAEDFADALLDDLGIRHVGWYYHYEPASEYHWSSNVADPPSHAGVSDVQPMFAARPNGSTGATHG